MSDPKEPADFDVSRVRARRMAIRREVLDMSAIQRQRAVCAFPLTVAQVAHDMQKMLDHVEQAGESKESREYLQYVEDIIREEFRNQFGREML